MKTILVLLILTGSTAFAIISGKDVCSSVIGDSNDSTMNACVANFNTFVEEQTFMAKGELAKAQLKANPALADKVLALALETAKKAEELGHMFAYNTAESVNLNALNYGPGSGVTCENALDYDANDYDPPIKKDVYNCFLTIDVRIIYLTNTCDPESDKIWNQNVEEMVIEFEMTSSGVINKDSITTKAFEIVGSCAG